MSNQWSPGEFQQSASMDIGDEVGVCFPPFPGQFPVHWQIAAMLGQSQLEAANVETLLGLAPGQQHRMAEQPLQQLDLSFMDTFQQHGSGHPYLGQQRGE